MSVPSTIHTTNEIQRSRETSSSNEVEKYLHNSDNREPLVRFVEMRRNNHKESSETEAIGHISQIPREIRMVASLSIPLSPLGSPRSDPASVSPRLQVRPYLLSGEMLGPNATEKLSARIIKDKAGCKSPSFVELDTETDLNIPPPGWLTDNQGIKSGASDLALVERASSHLTGALADLRISAQDESEPDFIASSRTMKTIFSLPFSNSSVTVAVHRVDNSLILQGLINGDVDDESEINESSSSASKTIPKDTSSGKKKRKGTDSKSLYSRFMYYSVSGESGVEPLVESEVGEGLVREERRKREGSDEVFRRAIHFQFHHLGYAQHVQMHIP